MLLHTTLGLTAVAILATVGVEAKYSSSGHNVFYYWGQNSAGGSNTQGSLASYCQSGQVDAVILSFLDAFNVGSLPDINLANACTTTFPGTTLLTCPAVGTDIHTCQSLGVKVILSLGGASGAYSLSGDGQAQTFATTIWNLFGGGSSSTRPFGDAIIDGIDLDIEGGPSTGYASLVTDLRNLFNPINANFLIGGAPQCPFPDAILGSVINAVGFDYVNVQFYNNYCSAAGNSFNFNTWANWATSTSPNKNVKVMFTIPGSATAAGSGYIPISTIQSIVPGLASTYPGVYGGVSVWDASQAWNNGDFASALYSLVKSGSSGGSSATTTSSHVTTASSTKTITASSTTTTAAAGPTATGTCVASGQACSQEGKYVCTANGAYAVCSHSQWVVTACPSGTICIPTADASSIYCGYASDGSTTCAPLNARRLFMDSFNKGAAVPKPYKVSQVTSQLTVVASTASEFKALLSSRRTVATPFGKQITIEFTAPANVKYTSVDSGSVRQVGTSVRIQAQNNHNATMAITVNLKGTISSGIFVAPNPASLRFK